MKFYLYILRQLLTGFFFSAAGMVFIAMPGMAVGAVHTLGAAGTLSVLKFVPMMVAVFVPYVLPVALLLVLVSTYKRLADQNEWTAIRMAGVNPYRMLVPAVVLATAAGFGVYSLNAELLPRIKIWQKTLQRQELKNALRNLSRGKTELMIGDFFLSSAYRDPEDPETFYDCYIELPSDGATVLKNFYAEAVRFDFDEKSMTAHMYGGRGAADNFEGGFEYLGFSVDLDRMWGDSSGHDFRNSRYQTSKEIERILAHIDSEELFMHVFLPAARIQPPPGYFQNWQRARRRLKFAWHQRMSNAATCLMFVLVGVSTGVMLRKGTQLSALAVAVGYAMVYWIASLRLGKQLAQNGAVEAWLGAWGPLAFFSLIGAWLTHRAFRE